VIAEWQAFEQIEPFGAPRIEQLLKVALAWIVSHLSDKALTPDDIKGISPPEPEPEPDPDDSAADDADFSDGRSSDADFGGEGHPTSADILRDLREQQAFL